MAIPFLSWLYEYLNWWNLHFIWIHLLTDGIQYILYLMFQVWSTSRLLKPPLKLFVIFLPKLVWTDPNSNLPNSPYLLYRSCSKTPPSTISPSKTSTYDSYLPLIFGKFALIWGHFQNILTSRFRGRWGPRGQTTSKSKTTKILHENLLKLDEIQNLASATSKMTSWPQWPRKRLSGFFQKIHF